MSERCTVQPQRDTETNRLLLPDAMRQRPAFRKEGKNRYVTRHGASPLPDRAPDSPEMQERYQLFPATKPTRVRETTVNRVQD